ncbi:uncharacterized protein LOC135488821 isoform X2 [Lineus longissimus]
MPKRKSESVPRNEKTKRSKSSAETSSSQKETASKHVTPAKSSAKKDPSLTRKVPTSYPKLIDKKDEKRTGETTVLEFVAKSPKRNDKGELVFEGYPDFQPNMTPKEVLQTGSFGGTYFRPIKSGVTGKQYNGVHKELPEDWLEGLKVAEKVSSSTYRESSNTYKVKCGGSLQMWEESDWIHAQDPYGWFQWYCRFYQGRRTPDDDRQIGRWARCAGVTGRWRNNLITKCVKSGCGFDNKTISPVVRQTLQHWGYKLNKKDFDAYVKKKKLK